MLTLETGDRRRHTPAVRRWWMTRRAEDVEEMERRLVVDFEQWRREHGYLAVAMLAGLVVLALVNWPANACDDVLDLVAHAALMASWI